MKKYALSLLTLIAVNAHARPNCGANTNVYEIITCDITSSATYEAGYTEVYSTAYVNFISHHAAVVPEKFKLNALAGNLEGQIRMSPRGDTMTFSVNQALQDAPQTVTVPVQFPDNCTGVEVPAFSLTSRYDAAIGNTASPRDLNVSCTAKSMPDKD